MYKVKTFNQIAVRGLEQFSRDAYEVGSEIADPQAILLRSHKLDTPELTPNLLAVARAGALRLRGGAAVAARSGACSGGRVLSNCVACACGRCCITS